MTDEEIDDVLNQAASAPGDLPPEIRRRLLNEVKPSLRPVRPLPPTWLITAGLVLLCAAVSLAGAAHAGFFGIEKMNVLERALVFSTLLLLASLTAIGFVHAMIPGSRRRLSPAALLAAVTVLLLCVFAFLFRDHHVTAFFSVGIACLLTGLLFALPVALLAWLILRRGFAVHPVSAGLLAGTLGGLAGLGMLELHCPNFQAAHVLVWHIAVIPVSAGVGACVAWLLHLRPRSGAQQPLA